MPGLAAGMGQQLPHLQMKKGWSCRSMSTTPALDRPTLLQGGKAPGDSSSNDSCSLHQQQLEAAAGGPKLKMTTTMTRSSSKQHMAMVKMKSLLEKGEASRQAMRCTTAAGMTMDTNKRRRRLVSKIKGLRRATSNGAVGLPLKPSSSSSSSSSSSRVGLDKGTTGRCSGLKALHRQLAPGPDVAAGLQQQCPVRVVLVLLQQIPGMRPGGQMSRHQRQVAGKALQVAGYCGHLLTYTVR
ncbi:hypothetical protein COO60DRAFT_1527430 [Scenedesmus sp. NREL 46B-D3]|nr:hypothetical protein COO60DRAFT_1527430 [Scenedesmus sp. NREL 46B-D3]